MVEPNCDMPWEIYLDWLQDQGNEDLRDIDQASLVVGDHNWQHYVFYFAEQSGEGYSGEFTDGETLVRDWRNQGETVFSGYGGDIHLREDVGCLWYLGDSEGSGINIPNNSHTGFGYCGLIEIFESDRALLRHAVGNIP